ncbi:MAG: Stk1 family PASTA domain-containing Ser/Thr kinase [Tissierellia bacterium]|nr:Stk1 family PASTA domain-containing Ser/Thr kinase [Tissierellia bacterium]
MIGNILKGRYEIIEELGTGGMGIVYLAYCSYLKRRVAIKVLLQDNQGKEETLLQEAKAAARLSHGNIVQIYDIFEEGNKTYIVMEYVRGKSLRQLISNQEGTPFTEQRALQLAMKLSSALHQAHLNGVIHRDIKPDNILIDQDGEPKITDFGIARVSNDTTIVHTDEILGSLRYSSPEQLRGSIIDERADIFSLGVVLFEMLTGTMPFPDDSPVTAAFKKLKQTIPKVSTINPEVSLQAEAIVAKATALDPKERFRNMSEFYYALSQALDSPKTYYKKSAIAAKKSSKPNKIIHEVYKNEKDPQGSSGTFLILIGLLLALVTVVLLGVPLLKGEAAQKDVEVPSFENILLKDAQILLDKNKLIGIVNEAAFSPAPKGTIIKQDPLAGDIVDIGTTIYFTVSKGEEIVIVPSLLGLSFEEAKALLDERDLMIGTVKRDNDKTIEKGLIMAQEIPADTEVAPATEINITLSNGPKEEEVTVPYMIGFPLSVAVERAQLAGIKINNSVEEIHNEASIGNVVAQSVSEGTKVKKDFVVTITISKGPVEEPEEEPVEVPREVDYTFVVDPTTFSAVDGVAIEIYYLRAVITVEGEERDLFSEYHEVTEGLVTTTYPVPLGSDYKLYMDALGRTFQIGAGTIQ